MILKKWPFSVRIFNFVKVIILKDAFKALAFLTTILENRTSTTDTNGIFLLRIKSASENIVHGLSKNSLHFLKGSF